MKVSTDWEITTKLFIVKSLGLDFRYQHKTDDRKHSIFPSDMLVKEIFEQRYFNQNRRFGKDCLKVSLRDVIICDSNLFHELVKLLLRTSCAFSSQLKGCSRMSFVWWLQSMFWFPASLYSLKVYLYLFRSLNSCSFLVLIFLTYL